MLSKIRSAKRLFVDLPRMLRLAYCLMFDARVPAYMKFAFGGGLALIALPVVDLPESLPVIGELDVLALSLRATSPDIGLEILDAFLGTAASDDPADRKEIAKLV